MFESWEGTHNVLCAQVLRDLAKFATLELVFDRSRGVDARVDAALDDLRPRVQNSIDHPEDGALHFRRQLDRLMRAIQAACLVREDNEAMAELHIRRHLITGYEPEADSDYAALLDRVLSEEGGALDLREGTRRSSGTLDRHDHRLSLGS